MAGGVDFLPANELESFLEVNSITLQNNKFTISL